MKAFNPILLASLFLLILIGCSEDNESLTSPSDVTETRDLVTVNLGSNFEISQRRTTCGHYLWKILGVSNESAIELQEYTSETIFDPDPDDTGGSTIIQTWRYKAKKKGFVIITVGGSYPQDTKPHETRRIRIIIK